MKLVVVGGVAGGASAAARARRIDAKAEIVIYERGEHVSFSNCSLPYYLGGVVGSDEDLIMMFPEDFKNNHDIDVYTGHEVTAINRDRKTVNVKNLNTGEEFEDSYDKLVLSPGAKPVMPKSIRGIDAGNVFTIRNVTDISRLKVYLDAAGINNVAVVGGGFIGIETAENLREAGKQVSVIEGTAQIMAPYDYDMVQILHKELDDHGINLYLESSVTAIEDGKVTAVKDGKAFSIDADAVIMAVGVAPETELAEKAGLEIGQSRGIKVNHNYQTTDPDIYAVGDAIESFNSLTHKPGRIALAGPAQRQARAAADHIYGISANNKGFIGSSCIKLFGLNAACTGLNEKTAQQEGFSYDSVMIFPSDRVGIMPGANYMVFKLIFEVPTGRILGAQAIGTGETDKRINVIATMITMGGTLEDLKELELCYAPSFSTAKDVVNLAALVALNVLNGRIKQVHVSQVRALAESGACIIDVRSPEEFEGGHLKCAKNIPLGQLRGRLSEIPKDVPVYLHCRSSQRSYYATCCLQGNGFENIANISGSFLGISLYEYFNDKVLNREPIVTAYNFD
ncbi:FAD-dependent oxidoreductase [Emergencia sp. 1XD21-10]|uniref:FAD-dependent oxidoreductase n=1 Tax=Emergencia sp. 1XD21-10 TaxID=2304569 RepID=UPI00137A982F|nr:FAD-dependent oxidoreductase [Emergencia sp. 1XD21-10]MCI9641036.1 FAD-dependent oxidoreductase [Emergencia sp.]NCF00423.1 pyridine nucleotide-disulfide oxidoreductase [Emergencia sp. 1XD21-10]